MTAFLVCKPDLGLKLETLDLRKAEDTLGLRKSTIDQ